MTAALAALYAFVCHVREERAARAAVRRVRERHPAAWQGLGWIYRRLASPSITVRILRTRDEARDPAFDEDVRLIARLTRHKLVAIGVGLACVVLIVLGTKFLGWTWG